MTAAVLKADLERAGFRLRVDAGKLLIQPASKLTPEQRAEIGTHRDALMEELQTPLPLGGEKDLATPERVRKMIAGAGMLAVDLETTGLDPRTCRIRLLSIGDGKRTLVLDCFAHDLKPLLPLLTGKVLVAHNATFDLAFLWHAGLKDLPETICTYLLGQLLTAGEGGGNHGFPPLGLKACCQRWLGREMSKEEQKSDWSGELTEAQIEYSRLDAAVLLPLFRILTKEIEAAGLTKASDVELRALPAFVWMAQNGVPFHREAWFQLAEKAGAEARLLEEQLDDAAPQQPGTMFARGWNWSSLNQVQEVFQLLGFNVETTSDAQLAEINHPLADLLRTHRAVTKKATTYGMDWLKAVAADGRVYPNWRQLGAASGRTSCIAEGTLVETVRDVSRFPKGIPIESVVAGDLVYTYDAAGRLALRKVTATHFKGGRFVLRVHWRGTGRHHKGHVDLTPDHLVRLTDGTWQAVGALKVGDSVTALSRGKAQGYARLWPTGEPEITREHRFVFEQQHGWSPEHVHHRNGNKLDQRLDNLEGKTASEHTAHHANNISEELRSKRSNYMRRRYQEGNGPKRKLGSEAPNWLGLTYEQVRAALEKNRWAVTPTARDMGHDFETFKRHLVRLGFNLGELKKLNRSLRKEEMRGAIAKARATKKVGNHTITRIEPLPDKVSVYDLTVEDTHNFIAGELCVHNCDKPNMQQIPREKEYRACIQAPEGRVLIKADFSQLQLRIAAKYSKDAAMLRIYQDNGDIHTATAQALLGKKEVTNADRQVAKSANFALLFGAGASGLRSYAKATFGLSFTSAEAEQHRNNFFATYRGLAAWHARVKKEGVKPTRGASGRRRLLPESAPITWMLNSPVQADEADGAKLALALLWERRKECPRASPVLLVHDEIVIEAPEADVEKAKAWLEKAMIDGMTPWIHPVPVVIETKVSKTWGG